VSITCLHQTVNTVDFFIENNENTNPKVRALMQVYKAVTQTSRGNWWQPGTYDYYKYSKPVEISYLDVA